MTEELKALMKTVIQMDNAILSKEKEIKVHSDKVDTLTKEVEEITIQLKTNITYLQKKLTQ